MWFVTELYQVTSVPLAPSTAKLSSSYYLAQKCLSFELPLCREGSFNCRNSKISPTRDSRNPREDWWFIAGPITEVAIFKDCRGLFKDIEEICGRTEKQSVMALLRPISYPPSHAAITLQGLQMPSSCK